jgi:predicted nucleic acid-binding protein
MKEPAIADSTCLIGLERIGQLPLLPALFEPLVVPPKVQEEFGVPLDWLQVQAPKDTVLIVALDLLNVSKLFLHQPAY